MSIRNGDTVVVHYVGTLNDGTEFESISGGQPSCFPGGRGADDPRL